MALFSCGKEATVDSIFVEKEFFIENPETATAKVLEFLSYTDLTEVTLRSDYPDTEVNEGLWTLEASGNYVDNVNLSLKSDLTINYSLSVTNTVHNGILKMSGADMTNKFNQVQASITAEESNGRTAKIVDFKLDAVSIQQTDLVVGIVYSFNPPPPPNVVGCEEWPEEEFVVEAGETIEECVLKGTNNYAWHQTISIVGNFNMTDCGINQDQSHIYEFDGLDVQPDEFDEAYAACQDFIDCKVLVIYGPPPPSNQTNIYGPPRLVDIDLRGDFINSNIVYLFVDRITLGRGVPY